MEKKKIDKILKLHIKWLNRDKNGTPADLSGENLSGADLRGANLRVANLSGADLSYADLSGANLIGADLSDADLSCANLSNADLRCANLRTANLSDADLRGAILPIDVVSITHICSRRGMTTYNVTNDVVFCRCFKGTLKEFESKVKDTHRNNPKYLNEYLGAIKYFKSLKNKRSENRTDSRKDGIRDKPTKRSNPAWLGSKADGHAPFLK